jgi:hypothetical protein
VRNTFVVNSCLPASQFPFIETSYRVIPSVLDPIKCEYLKDYSLDFE